MSTYQSFHFKHNFPVKANIFISYLMTKNQFLIPTSKLHNIQGIANYEKTWWEKKKSGKEPTGGKKTCTFHQ